MKERILLFFTSCGVTLAAHKTLQRHFLDGSAFFHMYDGFFFERPFMSGRRHLLRPREVK